MVWKHVVIYFYTDALLKVVDEAKQRSISASKTDGNKVCFSFYYVISHSL